MCQNRNFTILILIVAFSGCSTISTVLAPQSNQSGGGAIANPFSNYHKDKSDTSKNMILRTKKGDRSVEVEMPGDSQSMSDFVIPVSPAFKNMERGGAGRGSREGIRDGLEDALADQSYKTRNPTLSDREIIQTLPQGSPEDIAARQELEKELNLTPNEDSPLPEDAPSYLAALDHIKLLFRTARFEAALMEADELLRIYQTDPKLYEMRGTLLDRLGRRDLALKAWNQALRFNPKNQSLKKFLDRKHLASSGGSR